MDWMLVAILVLGVPVALAIWLVVRALRAEGRIQELSDRLNLLEAEVFRLKRDKKEAAPEPVPAPITTPQANTFTPPPVSAPKPVIIPPKAPASPMPPPVFAPPPPLPLPRQSPPPRKAVPAINWEQFMGVKLFAWLGGLALFLGVAFFLKYSFDNNLVSPALRVTIGFITGFGLVIGGVVMSRKDHSALAQTLCATGIVILYAVTFAGYALYHFSFFGPLPTFLYMSLITTTAFFLAVRLNALVVAILGMLGGFLTPILLATGQDNPTGLFGYIAVLDAGLIVIALHRRWHFLTALAAAGTAILQTGWADKFFVAGNYFTADKIFIPLGVLLGFVVLFLIGAFWAARRKQLNWWLAGALLGLAGVTLLFTVWFLTFAPLAHRPWLIFSFVFLVDLAVAALAWLDEEAAHAQPVFGLAVFGLLTEWTMISLTPEMLNAALAFFFIFAVFHSVLPVWLQQRRRSGAKPLWGSQVFPSLSLLLVLFPIFQLVDIAFVVWPFVLLIDVLAIGVAVATLSLWPVLIVLLLTLGALGEFIGKIPSDLTDLPVSLFLLGAFSILFVGVGVGLARKFKSGRPADEIIPAVDFADPANIAAQLPAFATILPFLLLIMATLRLPIANPSPVFGLALLLVGLLLGVTRLFSLDWLPAIGLVCVTALECTWHFNHFDAGRATLPLTWYLIFLGVFTLFPFLFLKKFADKTIPWSAAAMAGVPQFFLTHRLVAAAYPNDVMGLLPAAFAIPSLLSMAVVWKRIPAGSPARLNQLAWFGGIALFFITLIFPIQFHRQWITIGWALEGTALLWLFRRLPHPGLRLTGVGLLIAACVRLMLNPAVLAYHPHSGTPIFNWYLYAYGVVIICLFTGARLLAPPRDVVLGSKAPPLLAGLGIGLTFLLLNIEIADFFSAPGSTLTFEFGGNFAREMTYTISWALFAFILLVVGIVKKIAATRYAAMGLLCVTLLKLFFHDLAQLGQLYRIGAFIGVAIIAMLASFAYQKFFAAGNKEKDAKDESAT